MGLSFVPEQGPPAADAFVPISYCLRSSVYGLQSTVVHVDADRRLYLRTEDRRPKTDFRVTAALRWCKPLKRSESGAAHACSDLFSTGFSTETVSKTIDMHGTLP